MSMIIEDGGILTSVQDGGRFGFEQFGVSPSGPMDFKSMHIANILVDNDLGESCLEITFMGPRIRFSSPAVLAVAGADCSPALNGMPVPMCQAFAVKNGDVLKLGMIKNACRSYLAVADGIKVPVLMNSKCTMLNQKFGGHEGRRLQKNDVLELEKSIATLPNMQLRKASQPPFPNGEHVLRVIMGPQDDMFTDEGLHSFLNGVYTVGQEFNRQGYRLSGPKITHKKDGNIISDGIATGSVQVPTAGQPIVMLSERQTVGRYTKIATVITVDLPVIGQCKTGDKLRFRAVSIDEAQDLYIAHYREMDALRRSVNGTIRYKPAINLAVTVAGETYNVQVEEREE